MSKHTPGPWKVQNSRNGLPCQITAPNSRDDIPGYVGSSVTRTASICLPSSLEGKANANLMAAAPDLLAAAKMAEELIRSGGIVPVKGMTWKALRAAIAKAEGAK